MSQSVDYEVVSVQPATPFDKFLLGWFDESIKESHRRAVALLQFNVTLAASLLGGGLAFLPAAMPAWSRLAALGLLFLSLLVAIIGLLPLTYNLHPHRMDLFWQHKQTLLARRSWLLFASFSTLLGAFVAAGIGLFTEAR